MFVDFFADTGLIVLLFMSAVVGVYWVVKEKPPLVKLIPYVVLAGLTSLLVGKLLSFYQPADVRPFVELGVEAGAAFINNPGFPSDHALLGTVVAAAVFFLTPYRKVSYVLALLVMLISVARVLALVHTPLDIVGGVAAGLSGTLWYAKYKRDIK